MIISTCIHVAANGLISFLVLWLSHLPWYVFFKLYFLFMAAPGLCCCAGFLSLPWAGATPPCSEQASCRGFSCCRAQAPGHVGSGAAAPGLQSSGPIAVAHRLSCSVACGIFPDRGSNPHLLHWQVDSLLLSPQGSPPLYTVFGLSGVSHGSVYCWTLLVNLGWIPLGHGTFLCHGHDLFYVLLGLIC